MLRVLLLPALLLAATALVGCGDDANDDDAPSPWRHARVDGLEGATGITLVGDDLVFVSGGDDRDLRTVPRSALTPGGSARARTFSVTIRPGASVHGSTDFALQDYRLEHLWKVPVDFQAVSCQPPDMLYVGERNRRLIFWGRVRRDAAGVLASVKFQYVAVAPGAERTDADAGDWRDVGPGLRGLVAVKRGGRQEDLWLVDEGSADKPLLVRRMDRYGSNLQGLRARHEFDVAPDARALSHDGERLVVLLGKGRGRLVTFRVPPREKLDSVPMGPGTPGPLVEGVEAWTGMCHAEDGTVFLVSGGSPAVVAWRKP